MTVGRARGTVGPRSVSRSGACRRHRHRVDKSLPGRHSRPSNAVRECRHLPTPPAGRHFRREMPTARAAGDDCGRMHDRVLHMGGRETRGVSSVLPSCPERVHCCPVKFRPTGRMGNAPAGFRRIGRLGTRVSAHRRVPRRRSLHRPAFPTTSCPDLFRASTSLRRLARSRPAPRCRKTWMPGTSPGMTTGGEAYRRMPAPPDIVPAHRRAARPENLNRTAVEQVRA